MNKKEREQLLRDTLDQCLSGLDDLPSDRAEVNRHLAENTPELKRRIRFRRLAVPAAALVLCVCLIVTGTHLGMIPWPDRIRPQEAKATVAPVTLAQPTGEGTGTPEPAIVDELVPLSALTTDVELDRSGDTDYLAASFFASWENGNLPGMRSMTGVHSENPDYASVEDTFRILAEFYTPETLKIESISGTESDPVRTVTAVCGMKDSLFASFDLYRFRMDFTGKEGERLLDFRSLHSFDQLDADGQAVVRSITWPYLFARSLDFTLADSMVPLNLVSEKEGIRFELISAAVDKDSLLVVWSLQGPEGRNANPFLAGVAPALRCDRLEKYKTHTSFDMYDDESTNTTLVAEKYHYSGIDLATVDSITLVLDPVPVVSAETIDLISYYRQYGSNAQAVDFSLSPDAYSFSDQYLQEAPHVLDYTHPLDIPLTDNVRLDGIGDIDGSLHVQLHFVDNEIDYPAADGFWTAAKTVSRVDLDRLSADPFRWYENVSDFLSDNWVEYVFRPVDDRRSIPVTIVTADEYIQGGWSVEVPLSDIRVAEPLFVEVESGQDIESRFAEFIAAWNNSNYDDMLALCSPSWVSAHDSFREELLTAIRDRTPVSVPTETVFVPSGDTGCDVTAMVGMVFHNGKHETLIRMNIRMVREGSNWYVVPENLLDYRAVAKEDFPDLADVLRIYRPDCPTDFVPVGLSCEKEGFRLEVVSASVNEQSAFLIYSLQDVEGIHSDFYQEPVSLLCTYPWPYRLVYWNDLLYDDLSHTIWFAAEYQADPANNADEALQDNPRLFLAELNALYFINQNYLPCGDLLGKYGDRAVLVDIPELISRYYREEDGNYLPYDTSWYREQGFRVLDYTNPLSVPLHKNLELSGIGLIDGQLHVQLHYVDNNPVTYGTVDYMPVSDVFAFTYIRSDADSAPPMEWDTDGDGRADFVEYVHPCKSEDQAETLTVYFRENTGAVEGFWDINIPLETVWTGDPDADFLKTDVPEDFEITSVAITFFSAWNAGDLNAMLELCSPVWRSAQVNPKQELFSILQNRTPSLTAIFELISGSSDSTECEVNVSVSMYYNDRKPEVPIRMTIRMVRENNTWYIDPDSLVSYRKIPTPEPDFGTTLVPTPEPEAAPEPKPSPEPELNLITRLQQSVPDCLSDVVPVGLSCENGGFRLELVSASVKETAAAFIFSMQDLEGDRLSSGVLPYVDMPNEDSGRYGRNLRTSLIYDPSSRKAFFAAEAQYDSPEILLDDAQQISLSVADLLIDRTITLPLGDFLSQYGDRAALVDLPDLLPGNDMGPDGEDRVWTTDDYRKLGWKVLDYTHPLSVRLHKNLELSGIGVVDGQLHVQLRYLDNQTVRMGRYTTKPISFLYVWRPHESDIPNPKLEWDTDGDGSADFVEFVYPCESAADVIDDLEVVFDETLDYVEGSWTIDVPLETVWTGDQEDIETRLTEFIDAWNTNRYTDMLELCSPAWISAQEDPKQVLFMILQNRTPSSCTVESVSGSPGDTERTITAEISMYYNDRKPEVPIRMTIRMVRENNTWYIDPDSLVSYRIIETPVPEQ